MDLQVPAVVLENLHFSYPPLATGGPPIEVLGGLSLKVPAGSSVALMGPTSSGKTTLALVLAGLAPQMTGGTLRGMASVNGVDVAKMPAAQLSVQLGLVFQEPERQLFNMTVADEVAFGLEGLAVPPAEIGPRVAWALDRVGLGGLDDRAPWQLSGGQQKRLAIASILAMQPSILLLDEPLAGLDAAGRQEVAAVLNELKATTGATVIVIEQDAEFVARWAERVVVISHGQICMDGTPQAVFQDVERLRLVGVFVPQVTELALALGETGAGGILVTAREAAATLVAHLDRARIARGAQQGPDTLQRPGRLDHPLQPRPPEVQPHPPPFPAVDVQHVSFTYESGTQALADLSLLVPQGQFVALVGPNGSGKSTLARHLNGLLRPQVGSVVVNGKPTDDRRIGDLAQEVGYVFQNPDHQIFATTVREEIAYGLGNLGLKGAAQAERVQAGLDAFELQDVADVPPAVLGYGLRRLVTVASVWAMQPAIWVLDEPTTGLDAHFTAKILAGLRDLHQDGHTILLITHDLRLVAEAPQRIVVLHQGRVVLDGEPASLLADAEPLGRYGLRPPPITRLSGLLAPHGFPHPALTVAGFVEAWEGLMRDECRVMNDE